MTNMETKFNFNSAICTSVDQSRRLLELGLKKETADMCWQTITLNGEAITYPSQDVWINGSIITNNHFPAWSLGRLWELLDKIKKYEGEDELSYPRISLVEEDVIVENPKSLWVRQSFISPKGVYENIINCLEELIKRGYFNKEYLV